ncbi:MAG: hypothetical protein ABJH98_15400 [Reichenbachiella sp.]|uniref:hypothetical protein n=1 Tax=Reichenbachiella sp. TaxID=2184521 RepID=UPI00329A3A71
MEIRVVMLKKIKYYYYYIFFNAYWSSFDIGESTIPRQNAILYMFLWEIFLVTGLSSVLGGIGIITNLNTTILPGVAIILLLNYLVLSKAIFDDKFREYEFLSQKSKRKRLSLFFIIIVSAGIINAAGAFLFAFSDV